MTDLSRGAIEELIYKESRLLDNGKYREWLELYSNDAIYWIPSWISESELANDIHSELSILYLDRKGMEIYVARILTGEAHTFTPPSRTTRLISNLLVERDGQTDSGASKVLCKWLMQVFRAQDVQTYTGDAEYRIRLEEGIPKIFYKKVILTNDLIRSGQLIII